MAEQHNPSLLQKALRLEYMTIAWNVFEGIVCIVLGFLSGSIALIAFGLGSSVEVFASSVVIWELKDRARGREKMALKLIGCAYLVVSVYIFVDAIKSIMDGRHPEASWMGILFLFATAFVMLYLGLAKKNVGRKMGSASVLANAKFTLVDGALSTAVMLGLLTNSLFGWWWVDQALAIFLAGAAFREGIKELLG